MIQAIDDEDVNALLHKYLSAHPHQTYFGAKTDDGDEIVYSLGDQRFALKKPLLRRNKIVEGLSGPVIKYDVLGKRIGKGASGVVFEIDDVLTLAKSKIVTKKDGNHVVKVTYEYEDPDEFEKHLIRVQSTSAEDVRQERKQLKRRSIPTQEAD